MVTTEDKEAEPVSETGMTPLQKGAFAAGPVLGVAVWLLLQLAGLESQPAITAGIAVSVAVWWVFEPISIPATSMIPFVAFPLTGVLSNKEVAQAYGHWLILLLLGGFLLSAGMEKSGVHRRIALGIMRAVGMGGPIRVILGMMLATWLLSGWISNTATTLMMLPVALALCERFSSLRTKQALLMGIAYAASIGGIAPPIGTPPNVVLMGIYQETTGLELSFSTWLSFGYPLAITLVAVAWWLLVRSLEGPDLAMSRSATSSAEKEQGLGPISSQERRVLGIFILTAFAWITRKEPFGGWSELFGVTTMGDDSVALAAALAFFIIPAAPGSSQRLLDWETAKGIPWGLLILFGGGIALAKAFAASGLSSIIGSLLTPLATSPFLMATLIICLVVTFLTEVTSNTATTTLLMPILAAAAIASDIDPLLLMIPAALSASCAFMLPVATAPNAVVYGSGMLPVSVMARTGVRLNVLAVLVITFGLTLKASI